MKRMNLFQYEGKIIQVTNESGRKYTGRTITFPAEYGFHEYNREEESIKLGIYVATLCIEGTKEHAAEIGLLGTGSHRTMTRRH